MTPARILFGELPRMMRELLSAEMASQADMQVVGECANAELVVEIERVMANVVILRQHAGADDGLYLRLLGAYRDLKVVVVMDESRGATVHHLLNDPSPVTLVHAVRRALQSVGMNTH